MAGERAETQLGGRRFLAEGAVVLAALLGGLLVAVLLRAGTPVVDRSATSWWVLDLAIGAAACLALPLRRRRPTLLALALVPVDVVSSTANVAVLVAIFAVAAARPPRELALVCAAHLLGVFAGIAADGFVGDTLVSMITVAIVFAAVAAWGMYAGARRALVVSLRERAVEAERQRDLEADRARGAERTRIAREMHDVLGHRVSLISLQAGALEMQAGETTDTGRAAAAIGGAAHDAMEDLRRVIGVLRGDEAAPSEPLPAFADVPALVERSRAAGLPVQLDVRVPDPAAVPGALGRDAYRIVQEALTNVHKHAGSAPTAISLDGRPGETLAVEVRNDLPDGLHDAPGTGSGLVGLAERVQLAGGTFAHGRRDGRFVVTARLRWPA